MKINTVQAKFKCDSVRDTSAVPDETMLEVKLSAVYGNGKENKEWSKYTPAGDLIIYITNENVKGFFVEEKEYFLTFTPALQDVLT